MYPTKILNTLRFMLGISVGGRTCSNVSHQTLNSLRFMSVRGRTRSNVSHQYVELPPIHVGYFGGGQGAGHAAMYPTKIVNSI